MAKFSLNTHETRKTQAGTVNTVATQPYVRLAGPDGIYFLQNGKFFTEGGPEVTNVPEWVIAQADALNPTVQKEVGWRVQNSNKARAEALAEGKPASAVADPNQPLSAPVGVAGHPDDNAAKGIDTAPPLAPKEQARLDKAQDKAADAADKAGAAMEDGKAVPKAQVNYGKPKKE